nr:MAG TPA: hypothetical protein [Bacteriophage sp.]
MYLSRYGCCIRLHERITHTQHCTVTGNRGKSGACPL